MIYGGLKRLKHSLGPDCVFAFSDGIVSRFVKAALLLEDSSVPKHSTLLVPSPIKPRRETNQPDNQPTSAYLRLSTFLPRRIQSHSPGNLGA
jgi:hypothetical protein